MRMRNWQIRSSIAFTLIFCVADIEKPFRSYNITMTIKTFAIKKAYVDVESVIESSRKRFACRCESMVRYGKVTKSKSKFAGSLVEEKNNRGFALVRMLSI